MKIELSQREVSEIIANHFMNSPQFPNTDELRVKFTVERNWFGRDTLSCIVEEV
jgi:hypothetical protein